jgi:4-hydroxy-2-oxoheptanedioate aldolase
MKKGIPQGFKELIQQRPVFGPFCKTSDPGMIEALGYAGFDFVILDMEHGPNHLETIQHLIRAAETAQIAPIVRVPGGDDEMISRVLDIGAAGVQVPQVSSTQHVERIVHAAKFAPLGARGVCRYVRAAGYSSMDRKHYFRKANDALLIIQIEGEEALRNLDDILKISGPDIVFIGPYDLSQSLGVAGEVEHPLVIEKTKEIVKACLAKGIVVGNFTEMPHQAAFWTTQGLRYMAFSVDVGIMYEAGENLVAKLRRESGVNE